MRRLAAALLVMASLVGTPVLAVACELICLQPATSGDHHHDHGSGAAAPDQAHTTVATGDSERLDPLTCDHAPFVPAVPEATISAGLVAVPLALISFGHVEPALASAPVRNRGVVPLPSGAFSPLRI